MKVSIRTDTLGKYSATRMRTTHNSPSTHSPTNTEVGNAQPKHAEMADTAPSITRTDSAG